MDAVTIRPEGPGDAAAVRAAGRRRVRAQDATRAASSTSSAVATAGFPSSPSSRSMTTASSSASASRVGPTSCRDDGTVAPILALGPIAVAPDRQGRGIGAAMIAATVARATADGWPVICLLGHATYYPRFGFEPARPLGIAPQQPWSDEHWMALRLPAWRDGIHGTLRYPEAFGID